MKLMQSVKCVFGKHERSRSHAWQDGGVFRSRCRGCGKPMHRVPAGGWILDADADADPDSDGDTDAIAPQR